MILVLDNYDSFTFNLVQMLRGTTEGVAVYRNDCLDGDEIEAIGPSCIVISPGPGIPENAGISVEAIRRFGAVTPVLGVCLGHQAVASAFGARVVQADHILHGKTSRVFHDGCGVFEGLPNPFDATRYHSLVVSREGLPECLKVSAWTNKGEVMGLRHREYPVEGIQFHPESILTAFGERIVRNFIKRTEEKNHD